MVTHKAHCIVKSTLGEGTSYRIDATSHSCIKNILGREGSATGQSEGVIIKRTQVIVLGASDDA